MPANLEVATGGMVPPALQGHTPDIVLPFDPDLAREHLNRAGSPGELTLGAQDVWQPVLDEVTSSWKEILGIDVTVRAWTAETVDDVAPLGKPLELGKIAVLGWLPGYPDPEYCLRLILHSHAKANEGRYAHPPLPSPRQCRQSHRGRYAAAPHTIRKKNLHSRDRCRPG